jgi:hypothetical protein
MPNKPISIVKDTRILAFTLLTMMIFCHPVLAFEETDMSSMIKDEYFGRATYFGNENDNNLHSGHCGFLGNYGHDVVAVSEELWADGLACASCFELECMNNTMCHVGAKHRVTVTDSCIGCGKFTDRGIPPGQHFDLSRSGYRMLADERAGFIQVHASRVACHHPLGKPTSVHVRGNKWWLEARSEIYLEELEMRNE